MIYKGPSDYSQVERKRYGKPGERKGSWGEGGRRRERDREILLIEEKKTQDTIDY